MTKKKNQISSTDYQAKLATPFAVLGICVESDFLIGVEFLPLNTPIKSSSIPLVKEVCAQIEAYLKDPKFPFDLPIALSGTYYQKRVWQALSQIPSGQYISYGDLAKTLGTGPRAIGGACGANPISVIIPCHRVLAANGKLGGFMNRSEGSPIDIKQWLLKHEGI